MNTDLSVIFASTRDGGIGKDGQLPWRLKADMKFFKETTIGDGNNAVVMGRKTWESIPPKYRPLPKRLNIVLSSNKDYEVPDKVLRATSLNDALTLARFHMVDRTFVVGGAGVNNETLVRPDCTTAYVTFVYPQAPKKFECDTYVDLRPLSHYGLVERGVIHLEGELGYQFMAYHREG